MFTTEQIFEMHRILDVSDTSIKLGSKGFQQGTYTEIDGDNNISIVSHLTDMIHVKLTHKQEL